MKPEKLVPIAATTFSASNQSDSPRLKIEEYALLAAQLYSQPERSIELQSHYQMDAGSFLSEKKAWEKIFSKDTSLFAKYGTLYQRYCDWMKKK